MTYYDLARLIDEYPREVTDWEAHFLESILTHGPERPFTAKQQAKLRELGDRYLPATRMAEFHGQKVLL